MVVIALISIIILGATRVDFNRSSNQQKLAIFTNEIVSKIETVRNNALIWKGIGIDVETPDQWRIIIWNTSPGSIETSYYTWGSWTNSDEYSVNPDSFYEITDLNCISLDNNITEAAAGNRALYIDGNELALSEFNTTPTPPSTCSNNGFKILEFTTSYRNLTKTVRINTLSWLIEVD